LKRITLVLGLVFCALSLFDFAPAGAGESVDMTKLPGWQRYAWQDLGLLMSRSEEAQLRELPDAEASAEWVRRFWLRRDPTPTTDHNERREEHFKRLETARSLYGADDPMGLDRRGRDYVLFGAPDEVSEIDEWFDDTGHHPARLIWIWLAPEMRAAYSDWNLDGEWDQAWDELPSSRPDVRQRLEGAYLQDSQAEDNRLLEELRSGDPLAYQDLVRQLAEGELVNPMELQSQKLMADLMGSKFRRMEAAYHENRRERKDTYVHDFELKPLWAVFAVDCFRGESGRSRVELSHQLRPRDLRFEWDFEQQVFSANILRRVVFYDENEQVAAGSEDRVPVFAESITDTRSDLLLPGLSVHQLRAGSYRMALRLEDEIGGSLQVFSTRVEVPAFPADSLLISDICFASGLGTGSEPALFRKGEWIVSPHPLHMYTGEDALRIYFEVYGLTTDDSGLNDYTVTYRIRPRNPLVKSSWLWTREENVDTEVGSTFADRHGGEMARHPLSLSAANFAEDSYLLEVEVHDRLGESLARQRARFSIVSSAKGR
jgi:GWxTD domain-containing protein